MSFTYLLKIWNEVWEGYFFLYLANVKRLISLTIE